MKDLPRTVFLNSAKKWGMPHNMPYVLALLRRTNLPAAPWFEPPEPTPMRRRARPKRQPSPSHRAQVARALLEELHRRDQSIIGSIIKAVA